jgi:hypothetical protein
MKSKKKKHEYTFSVSAEMKIRVVSESLEDAAHKINHVVNLNKKIGGCLFAEAVIESFHPVCIMRDGEEYDMGWAFQEADGGYPRPGREEEAGVRPIKKKTWKDFKDLVSCEEDEE